MALSNRIKFRARLGQFKLPLYTVSQPGPEKLLQFLDLPAPDDAMKTPKSAAWKIDPFLRGRKQRGMRPLPNKTTAREKRAYFIRSNVC